MKDLHQKNYDVVAICNALMDIIYEVDESDIVKHGLMKGCMQLVDADRQKSLITALEGRKAIQELGGSSLNAIRALAMLGQRTCFAGMTANDKFGMAIQARMRELGIQQIVHQNEYEPTGTCLVLVTPDHERTMVTHLGASRLYNRLHVPAGEVRDAGVLHFCGYQWDTEGQKEAISDAIDLAVSNGVEISFDVADPFVVGLHTNDFRKIIEEKADIVFANQEEAKLLYGLSPEETARKIAGTGAIAVIKLGAEGALIAQGDEIIRVAAVPTEVLDTTAAGDMFAAGFLFGYTRGKSLAESGHLGATLASDVIRRHGASLSPDVIDRVRRF